MKIAQNTSALDNYIMTKMVLTALVVLNITMLSMIAITQFNHDQQMYTLESDCVRDHVSKGVERSDIATGDGTCWVKL